jgi:hypothetical protein
MYVYRTATHTERDGVARVYYGKGLARKRVSPLANIVIINMR